MTAPAFSSSKHITAYGPTKPYLGISMSYSYNDPTPVIGDVRYSDSHGLMVWNGSSWQSIHSGGSSYTIGMVSESERALDWAVYKMKEEQRIKELASKYPAIQDLLNQKSEIDNKIKMIEQLVQEEKKVGTP